MAHCKSQDIEDLESVLDQIRELEAIKEKGHGKFYLKSASFLHFHIKADRRWADIRNGADWGSEVDISCPCSKKESMSFMAEVKRRYKRTLAAR
jgi:hypothetical protein